MNVTPKLAKDVTDRNGNFLNQDNAELERVLDKARHIIASLRLYRPLRVDNG